MEGRALVLNLRWDETISSTTKCGEHFANYFVNFSWSGIDQRIRAPPWVGVRLGLLVIQLVPTLNSLCGLCHSVEEGDPRIDLPRFSMHTSMTFLLLQRCDEFVFAAG